VAARQPDGKVKAGEVTAGRLGPGFRVQNSLSAQRHKQVRAWAGVPRPQGRLLEVGRKVRGVVVWVHAGGLEPS